MEAPKIVPLMDTIVRITETPDGWGLSIHKFRGREECSNETVAVFNKSNAARILLMHTLQQACKMFMTASVELEGATDACYQMLDMMVQNGHTVSERA